MRGARRADAYSVARASAPMARRRRAEFGVTRRRSCGPGTTFRTKSYARSSVTNGFGWRHAGQAKARRKIASRPKEGVRPAAHRYCRARTRPHTSHVESCCSTYTVALSAVDDRLRPAVPPVARVRAPRHPAAGSVLGDEHENAGTHFLLEE